MACYSTKTFMICQLTDHQQTLPKKWGLFLSPHME